MRNHKKMKDHISKARKKVEYVRLLYRVKQKFRFKKRTQFHEDSDEMHKIFLAEMRYLMMINVTRKALYYFKLMDNFPIPFRPRPTSWFDDEDFSIEVNKRCEKIITRILTDYIKQIMELTKSFDTFGPILMALESHYREEVIEDSEDQEEMSDHVDTDSTDISDTQINGDGSYEFLD